MVVASVAVELILPNRKVDQTEQKSVFNLMTDKQSCKSYFHLISHIVAFLMMMKS